MMARPRKPGKDSPERRAWEADNPLAKWIAARGPKRNSVAEVALACKCTGSTVYNWLTGNSDPAVPAVQEMAKLLKVDFHEFDDLWLAWWKKGVEKGFVKKTLAAQRMLRLLAQQKKKPKE